MQSKMIFIDSVSRSINATNTYERTKIIGVFGNNRRELGERESRWNDS